MARPNPRDLFSWLCTLVASSALVVCLFLPQVDDKTPFDTGTAGVLFGFAALGLAPLAWRSRSLRQPILLCVGTATAGLLIMSVIGIAALVAIAFVRSLGEEEIAALCSFCLVLGFLILFPLVGLFAHVRVGGELAWAAGWLELIGMIGWASAASRR